MVLLILRHAYTCAYISSHSFILLLLLKELIKCKSSNEKRYWTAKAYCTFLYLTRKKGKRHKMKCMMPKKKKKLEANSSNWNIKSFRHRSHNEMCWFKKIKWYDVYGAKWKASKLCYQVMWEVIYAYVYNWDRSLYLVLVVYALVELIIETSL